MFVKKSFETEIAKLMEDNLISNAFEEKTQELNKIAKALEYLNNAAEIFDDIGLTSEAEIATNLLEVVAKKKDKNKKVVKKDKYKTDKLTSEKMVKNLKEKGWVFNDANDAIDAKFDKDVEIFDKNNRLIAFVKREFAHRVLKSFPSEIGAHIKDYEDRFVDKSEDSFDDNNDTDDNLVQDKEFDILLKKLVKDTKDWEDEE